MPDTITPDAGSSPAMPQSSFSGAFAELSEAAVTGSLEGSESTEFDARGDDANSPAAQASENNPAPVNQETQPQEQPALADENWDNVHPRAKELWEKSKTEATARAAAETKLAELQQKLDAFGKFGDPDRLNEILAKRLGYESIDQMEERLAANEKAASEAALKAELDAWEAEEASRIGEMAAAEKREIKEQAKRLEMELASFKKTTVDAQQLIQQQALSVRQDAVLAETLKQVPSDAHDFVRQALKTTTDPSQIPAVSKYLIDLCRAVENGTKARYGVTSEARDSLPVPSGAGGQGVAQVASSGSEYKVGQGLSLDMVARGNRAATARD